MPSDVILKLPRHYSQAELSRVTGESVANLQWYRKMGWLKPSKRTPKRERFNIEAYKEAVRRSAEHQGNPVAVSATDKPQKLTAAPNFFDDLRKSVGLTTKKRESA